MINDKKYYDETIQIILEEWDVETLIKFHVMAISFVEMKKSNRYYLVIFN